MRLLQIFFSLLSLTAILHAANLPLFNTGVDKSGKPLPGDAPDANWTITSGPGISKPIPATVKVNQESEFYAQDLNSRWVWVEGAETLQSYTLQLMFDLSDYNHETATVSGKWAVDNVGVIKLNGEVNGIGSGTLSLPTTYTGNFVEFHEFALTSGFQPGINTMEFVVADFGGGSGLNVADLAGTAEALVQKPQIAVTEPATKQTFKNLYVFAGGTGGAVPAGGVVLSGNFLYGTANKGGSSDNGTVFKMNPDGTGLTILHSFTATTDSANSDGANPFGGVILSDDILYGTTRAGGASGAGTIFRVNIDGTSFENLYSFSGGIDGDFPNGKLLLSDNTLYGATEEGGKSESGTVFRIHTDGTGFVNLHRFEANTDGANPKSGLVLRESTLYGTTSEGGGSGSGSVFAISTDGIGFTNLYSFSETSSAHSPNSDGAKPSAGLLLSGNTLYGTTFYGGTSGYGTVFKVRINGTGFMTLYSFPPVSSGSRATNSTGSDPFAGLILSGDTLYGTTHAGGTSGFGTVYQVNTDGTDFMTLHSFTGGSGGGNPFAGLILSGLTLYGTTGSSASESTAFSN